MTISVLIPFGGVDEQRERLFRWVMQQWGTTDDFQEPLDVVVGHQMSDGPWCKGEAYQDALSRSRGEIVIFTDADVWVPRLPDAVEMLTSEEYPWVRGVDEVKRLNRAATDLVLDGSAPITGWEMAGHDETTYTHDAAGAGTVLWRKDAEAIPIDCRFLGWGHEDSAFGFALETLVGHGGFLNGSPCYHLWHEPQERQSRTRGSDDSWRLWRRYYKAYGDRVLMQELVDEARKACDALTVD